MIYMDLLIMQVLIQEFIAVLVLLHKVIKLQVMQYFVKV